MDLFAREDLKTLRKEGDRPFGTARISGIFCLFLITFDVGMIILEEVRKWLLRHRHAD